MDVNIYRNGENFKVKPISASRFQFVADSMGLPLDQIRFLFAQLLALIVAYLFRVFFHPNNVSATSRHWTSLSAGIFLSYFCFGKNMSLLGAYVPEMRKGIVKKIEWKKQILLAFLLVIICYCILNFLPPSIFHHATLFASVSFLSAVHIHHQLIEDEGFSVDVSGPLMIIVQKATSLAYSLNDGWFKEPSQLTVLQKKFLIKAKPTTLEYFSYLLCYHSILAGPFFMFTDYQDFIEGNIYLRYDSLKEMQMKKLREDGVFNNNRATGNNNLEGVVARGEALEGFCVENHCRDVVHYEEPNPMNATLSKLAGALFCAFLIVVFTPIFPVNRLSELSFVNSSVFYILFYILVITTLRRQLYYSAWLFTDAVCSMSGFGFNGYDVNGKPKWDLVSNIDAFGVEFGTSLRTTLEAWNIGTMKWLRFLVYERATSHKTIFTYLLSSIWHGFYPGYYLTFLGGAFFTIVSRVVRRSVRPRVLRAGSVAKRIYDFATLIVTRLCLSYMTFPFVLLKFWPSIAIYRALSFYLHILGILAVLVMPIVLPPIRDGKELKKENGKRMDQANSFPLNSNLNVEELGHRSKKLI